MPVLRLAFDKSARRIDADGRLHVERNHISKAAVNPYYGKEIPDFEALGLVADKVYRLLRDPVELERAAPTFARLPVLKEHVPVTVDAPRPDLVVGAIGSEVTFNSPYLDADLCVWDGTAIAGIETDKVRELSCAYRYIADMTAGIFDGAEYDGKMTQIQGNHLALVEVGRAGADVVVADNNPFRGHAMKMTKMGKALTAAFCAVSPTLAADAGMPALFATAARKTFDKKGAKAKLLALDAEMAPEMVDSVMDSIVDMEADPKPKEPPPKPAQDDGPGDKVRAILAGKCDDATIAEIIALMTPDSDPDAAPAQDDAPATPGGNLVKPTQITQPQMQAAMDAATTKLRGEMREAAEAARDVRATCGDVIGMDSAADIYGFALDAMKVDRKGVEGTAALRALYKLAATRAAPSSHALPIIGADAASGAAKRFPGLDRFTHA